VLIFFLIGKVFTGILAYCHSHLLFDRNFRLRLTHPDTPYSLNTMVHTNELHYDINFCKVETKLNQFLLFFCREQRVTHILIFITIGLSVFMRKILGKIPMPVLYGVFLYMGTASLDGLQFYNRLLLIFMPKKYQVQLIIFKI